MRIRILLGILLLAMGLVTACEPEGSFQEGEDQPTEMTTDGDEMTTDEADEEADEEADDNGDDAEAAEVEEVAITATADGYELPETVEAGLKRFVLVNETQGLVQAQLIKLDGDHTADDVMEWLASMAPMSDEGAGDDAASDEGEGDDATSDDAMSEDAMAEEGGAPPEWMTMWGGPNPPPPGGSSDAYVELEPGNYAVASFIPGPDGQLGAARGYLAGFEVVEAEDGAMMAQAPEPDITIEGVDFAFSGGRFDSPGDYVVNFQNAGAQDHEIVVVKLDEGATTMDFIEATGPGAEGPPPGVPLGGIVALPPDSAQAFSLSLEPGRYAAICFLEDPETGQPHFALGMLTEYEIEE